MTKHSVEITCGHCGSKDFEYPGNPQPDDIVTCTGCGAIATYKEIIEATEAQSFKLLRIREQNNTP